MYRYQQGKLGPRFIVKLDENLCIPEDPENTDYQTFLDWVAAGNTAEPIPSQTLDEVKTATLENLQAQKGIALSSMQYTYANSVYTVTLTTQDQVDVSTQLQLLQAEPAGSTINWELVNNTFFTWQLSDLQALQMAGVTHVQTVYANVKSLAASINAATDVASVNAVDINSGWPS